MNLSFDKIFKAKPLSEMEVQNVVLEKMNEDLTCDNIKYVSTGNGYCALTTDGDSLNLGGFKFSLNKEDKLILGEKPSIEDIVNYSYNAQRPLKLQLKEDGYIIINGQRVEINKVMFKPLANLKVVEESLYAFPQKFPNPFEVTLSCGDFERELKVSRVPNNSVSILSFESIEEEPLVLKYSILEEKGKINFGLSYNFEYAKSLYDLIECANIYNGFFEGKAKFFNSPLKGTETDFRNKIDNDVVNFWQKAYEIECYMGVKFNTSILDVDSEDRDLIEKLYYGLVKHKPIRENKHLTSATFEEYNENAELLIGNEVYFEFQGIDFIDLFGQKFDIHCVIGLYGVVIEDIQKSDNKYKVVFSSDKGDGKSFMVLKYFKSLKKLNHYRKNGTSKRITKLHSAKTVFEYYEEDKSKHAICEKRR